MLTATVQTATSFLPAYTWVDDAQTTAIAADWIGDVSYPAGQRTVNHLYRLVLQVRHGRHIVLGQIQQTTAGWIITAMGRAALPEGESLAYSTWQEAQTALYTHHLEIKRSMIRAAAE